MWVETAVYGEVNGGHGLRRCSGDAGFARRIAARLDLPSNPPPGVIWSPYVSGFADGRFFVVARTFPDTEAPRGGMVRSHALIASLEEIGTFADLGSLFGRLGDNMDQPPPPTGFDIHDGSSAARALPELNGLANRLVARSGGPVVRLGMEGFDDLVAALWANLWPEARPGFAFRLSFSPQDVVETPPPVLISTPASLSARWPGDRIAPAGEAVTSGSLAAAALAGTGDATPVLTFGRSLGADLRSVGVLSRLHRTKTLAEEGRTFGDLVGAVRLVDTLSPNDKEGALFKASLMQRLCSALQGCSAGDILMVRNLSFSGFSRPGSFWEGIQRWWSGPGLAPGDDRTVAAILEAAADEGGATEPWRDAVFAGIQTAARNGGAAFALAAWRWMIETPAALNGLWTILPAEPALERRIAETMPQILSEPVAQDLLQRARQSGWLRLHGAVLAATHEPFEAGRLQLEADMAPDHTEGLSFALARATGTEIIKLAVETQDSRIIQMAAARVAQEPVLFSKASGGDKGNQRVWDASIRLSTATWDAPADPFGQRNVALDAWLDGGDIHLPLLEAWAATPLADLSGYPRAETVLSGRIIDTAFGDATARGWLRRAVAGEVEAPGEVLTRILLSSPELAATLARLDSNVAAALRVITALPELDENRFVGWIGAVLAGGATFTTASAETIGLLILTKGWKRTLDTLIAKASGRTDVKPALRICKSMIGFFTLWTLDLSQPTLAEKWDSFAQLASELYPSGPDQDALWRRAGGKDADLPRHGNGRAVWRAVLEQVRLGRGPSALKLLREMTADYPKNPDLALLQRDHDLARGT